MAALNDRAGVEMLQTYIGTALRSERLLCSDSSFCHYSQPMYKVPQLNQWLILFYFGSLPKRLVFIVHQLPVKRNKNSLIRAKYHLNIHYNNIIPTPTDISQASLQNSSGHFISSIYYLIQSATLSCSH